MAHKRRQHDPIWLTLGEMARVLSLSDLYRVGLALQNKRYLEPTRFEPSKLAKMHGAVRRHNGQWIWCLRKLVPAGISPSAGLASTGKRLNGSGAGNSQGRQPAPRKPERNNVDREIGGAQLASGTPDRFGRPALGLPGSANIDSETTCVS